MGRWTTVDRGVRRAVPQPRRPIVRSLCDDGPYPLRWPSNGHLRVWAAVVGRRRPANDRLDERQRRLDAGWVLHRQKLNLLVVVVVRLARCRAVVDGGVRWWRRVHDVVGGGRRDGTGTGCTRRRAGTVGDAARVPVTIVLEHVQQLGAEWVYEVGPRLPQRMNDEVDETDLHKNKFTTADCIRACHGGSTSRAFD